MKLPRPSMNLLAVLVLGLAFSVSAWKVWNVHRQQSDPNIRIIRIAHWQLEAGYREALQDVIDEYNRIHAADGIKVVQMPVTEKVYEQWTNVNLISGNAPDLMEKGKADQVRGAENTARYFAALGDEISRPNPYNRPAGTTWTPPAGVSTEPGTPGAFHLANDGTFTAADGTVQAFLPERAGPGHLTDKQREQLRSELQHLPWRQTFLDGMQGGFDATLQDYYAVPTSFWGTIRLVYSKSLVKLAMSILIHQKQQAGEPIEPWLAENRFPETIGRLLELSAALRRIPTIQGVRQARKMLRDRSPRSGETEWLWSTGRPENVQQILELGKVLGELPPRDQQQALVVPVACTRYMMSSLTYKYLGAMTLPIGRALDTNWDGIVDWLETMTAFQRGDWDFDQPNVKAYHEIMAALADLFPHGFMGMGRESSVHMFVQQQAAMRISGAWDAHSLMKMADFDIGVARLPLPGKDERWGQFAATWPSEAGATGGAPFAVYRFSENKEWAVDFMRFLTSYRWNQQFNQKARWIPVTQGTVPADTMLPFMPSHGGPARFWGLLFRPPTVIRNEIDSQLWLFIQGEADYATLSSRLRKTLEDPKRGIDSLWFRQWRGKRDLTRNLERSLTSQRVGLLMLNDENAKAKYKRLLQRQVDAAGGAQTRAAFDRQEHRPFPTE